jgi:hypothetical protein
MIAGRKSGDSMRRVCERALKIQTQLCGTAVDKIPFLAATPRPRCVFLFFRLTLFRVFGKTVS